MNGLDAIVFTAGVGENDMLTRELVCRDMDFFGIRLDATAHAQQADGTRDLSTKESRTRVLVVPTNEELEIARQCRRLSNEERDRVQGVG